MRPNLIRQLVFALSLTYSLLMLPNGAVGQTVDEGLPDKIGTGTHSTLVKSISSLFGVALRSHASADVLRYKNVTSVEYHNGTAWVALSTTDWKNVLDGVDGNAWTITNNKVRLTIDLEGAWIRPSAFFIGQDWNSGERDFSLLIESSPNQSTWATRLASTPSGTSNTAQNIFMIDTQTGVDQYIRLTFESLADSSNPLHLLQISAFTKRFVGLKNHSTLPIYTNYERLIGIGNTNPKSILSIGNHSGKTLSTSGITLGSDHKSIEFLHSGSVNGYGSKLYGIDEGNAVTSLRLAVRGNSTTWTDALYVKASTDNSNGYVGIGTTNPTEKLTVAGTAYAQEVRVEIAAGSGPDYVFEPGYKLPSLESMEKFIKSEKHLPEIPPAKEMEESGVQLGEMNMLLLKKIEELTLHAIKHQKLLEEQKKINERLIEKINILEKSN